MGECWWLMAGWCLQFEIPEGLSEGNSQISLLSKGHPMY